MSINNYPIDWQDAWHTQLTELRDQFPRAYVYGLIEGVHNESCYPLLKRSGSLPFFALFANTPCADEETLCVSPLLVEYFVLSKHTWDALLQKTDGLPALSVIVTPESLEQLSKRLAPWCIVDASDHRVALSFADTRILPILFDVLVPQQLAQFCGPALHWQYVTRAAKWQALPLPTIGLDIVAPADTVVLNDQQCAQLMHASESDNLLFQLRRNAAHLVDCHTPARAHEIVGYWLRCADHAQMDAAPDRFDVCHMGLTHPHLTDSKQINTWLTETSQSHTYQAFRTRWISDESERTNKTA